MSVDGTRGPDALRAFTSSTVVIGYDSNDDIRGVNGNDILYGGYDGSNQYNSETYYTNDPENSGEQGVSANDVIIGDGGDDTIYGNSGNDILYGDRVTPADITGKAGNDFVAGGAGSDEVFGGPGNDFIFGGNATVEDSTAGVEYYASSLDDLAKKDGTDLNGDLGNKIKGEEGTIKFGVQAPATLLMAVQETTSSWVAMVLMNSMGESVTMCWSQVLRQKYKQIMRTLLLSPRQNAFKILPQGHRPKAGSLSHLLLPNMTNTI